MEAVLPPLFVQVGLTFVLGVFLASSRVFEAATNAETSKAVKAGQSGVYTNRTLNIGANFSNQFEVPVLFYVAVLLAIATGPITDSFINLAWVFAISRIVHALIHCTINIILLRFVSFIVGVISLALMWWQLFQSTLAG